MVEGQAYPSVLISGEPGTAGEGPGAPLPPQVESGYAFAPNGESDMRNALVVGIRLALVAQNVGAGVVGLVRDGFQGCRSDF
jgi:hypothetical protein